MKISFVRGAYLNNYEGQSYDLPLTGYSSLFPIDDKVPFPVKKLPSIADLQRIPVLERPIKYIANRTLGDSQILFGLEDQILGSDIVHVGDPHYYYSYQAAKMREKGTIKKLISTWWETIPFNNESTRAKRRIKKYTMEQVDTFVVYTNASKACLISEGVSIDKINYIPLGVDLKIFFPHFKKESNTFTILFVGRLVEEKGILDVYAAFKNIARTEDNIYLTIVGSGPLEKKLKSLIFQDNLTTRVVITKKSYQEMPEIYAQADVLCVPSKKTTTWEEQYGMVLVEAMASGLPIVSYDTGVIPEIIADAGIIVTEGNSKELVASLMRIVKEKDLAHKLGTIGRDRAEKLYNCRKTSEEIFKLYKTLDTNH